MLLACWIDVDGATKSRVLPLEESGLKALLRPNQTN